MIRIRLPYSKIVSLLFMAVFLTMLHQDILKPAGAILWIKYSGLVDDVIEVETLIVGVPTFIQDKQSWEDFCSVGRFKTGDMLITNKQLEAMHNLSIDPNYWDAETLNQSCREFYSYKTRNEFRNINMFSEEGTLPPTQE